MNFLFSQANDISRKINLQQRLPRPSPSVLLALLHHYYSAVYSAVIETQIIEFRKTNLPASVIHSVSKLQESKAPKSLYIS